MDLFGETAPPPEEKGAPVTIEGVIARIVFESAESGFYVARLREEGKVDLTTIVGAALAVAAGETVRVTGRWVKDPRFGRQLRVEGLETVMPKSPVGIERFLGSGLIKGIGPKYAKRLVAAFGVDTLRIIEDEPERLHGVEGIGRKRAEVIREAFSEHRAIRSLMVFLQGHGLSLNQAHRIYNRYGDRSVAVLRENPYRLIEDIPGMGFKGADAIADQLGIEKDSLLRAEAGLLHVLRSATGNGHVFLPADDLAAQSQELLGVDSDITASGLTSLVARGAVVREGDSAYLQALFEAESGCAKGLRRLLKGTKKKTSIDTARALAWVEDTLKIDLSPEQREAVAEAVAAPVMVITGGPGTGKTTVVNSILSIVEKKGFDVALAAPTGRAAKRLAEAADREARTLHRLLEYSPIQGGFTRNEAKPLAADIVVVDEMSMVDVHLFQGLLTALPDSAQLIMVGDVDQLPSVGPGNVLLDVIASLAVPTVRLKTVFRQAAESGIVANAHRVNQGQYPEFNAVDFFHVERDDPEKTLETVVELVTERIPKKFGLDPLRDVQVLAPMHRGAAGVARLNEALQQALNPRGQAVPGRPFCKGDKVMQLRNNYDLDVYNGDVGVVGPVDEDDQTAQIRYDDREVLYSSDMLDDVALAYAATIHKSQGSEYPAVVLPLMNQHYMMLHRNVLYTALTRAKRIVVVVGEERAIQRAVRNVESATRFTGLAERLRADENL
jgi:exodeoxyribonuclease V alpha subunit